MAVSIERPLPQLTEEGRSIGIDQPAGWWPTASRLKSYEAAGFDLVQVAMPPRSLLRDGELRHAHAAALRETLALTGLRLVLNSAEELTTAAIDYAELAGAELLVIPPSEERVLRRACGVQLAIENLARAYVYERERAGHDPLAVYELVSRLELGMCLDVGHAHITAELTRRPLPELIAPVLDRVILFHIHDNFGARPATPHAGGIEPFKLDLHLSPGAGTVPWDELRPVLSSHPAPVQLAVHPARRPDPATLAVLTREVLGLARPARTA
jgi:sugar phosphate isomerase/epimerase